jgi:peptidyl-prolyl cis-trans isomerase SurA
MAARSIIVTFFAVLTLACGDGSNSGIVAKVNDYKITATELEAYYASQYQDQDEPENPEQAQMLRLNLLRELIDRHLILQKAESLGLMAVDDEVDQQLENYRSPFDSEDEFTASLADRGMSIEDLRLEVRRRLTIEKLFNKQITARVTVTEEELRGYYEQNVAAFTFPEQQVHLAQILVTNVEEVPVPNLRNDDATDAKAAKEKIEMLHERVEKGEDFATLAQNYSEDPDSTPNGGDMGFFAQSSLEKAHINLRRAVASLQPGEVSDIVETDGQHRILRLISIEAAGQREFTDPAVQQQLRDMVTNRKEQLMRAAFFDVERTAASIRNYLAEDLARDYGIRD